MKVRKEGMMIEMDIEKPHDSKEGMRKKARRLARKADNVGRTIGSLLTCNRLLATK
jgi:hypothetical protein